SCGQLLLHAPDLLLALVQPLALRGGERALGRRLGSRPPGGGELTGEALRADTFLELGQPPLALGDRGRPFAEGGLHRLERGPDLRVRGVPARREIAGEPPELVEVEANRASVAAVV